MGGEAKAKFYACEILLGLEDLHAKNIIYRDLKLENVLLDVKGHCYLSDFGLAVQKKHSDGYSGTPGYIAPEIILKQKYDRRIDFFSYGVLVYRMLAGKKPFAPTTHRMKRMKRMSKRALYDYQTLNVEPCYPRSYFCSNAKNFLQQLLRNDPSQRLGSNNISEKKNHPWFADINWKDYKAHNINPPTIPHDYEFQQELDLTNTVVKRKASSASVDTDTKILDDFNYNKPLNYQHDIIDLLNKSNIQNDATYGSYVITNEGIMMKKKKRKKCTI